MGDPVAQAAGRFETEIVVLDRSTGRFEALAVGTETVKVASDGYGSFFLDVAVPPNLREAIRGDQVSAWRTHGSFATKRGDSLVFVCSAFSSS